MAEVSYYFNARGDVVWTDPDNIVDNNLETFGYTSTNGAAQVLTGNTCPGTDLGTITKVELRLFGKGDGNDRIDVTPVFTGGNGDTHETTPVVDPGGWVAYVDITSDTNAPDWSLWSHVQTIDCKLAFAKVGKGNTMYCAKVEIRVTYTPEPTVTTQAVTDIEITTATGHGTIVAVGIENASKRGICWNKTGNPTVADDKSEETDSFGTGAFSRPMTGLDPSTHYYVKAYAYNSAGYGYGNEVEFDTPWEPPVSDIDVGAEPINRVSSDVQGYTYINKNNPANASGILHSVKVWAYINLTGFRVGTFYTTNGNTLKCRDSVLIGDVEAGAERTFTELSIDVQEGDYIGCYFDTGYIDLDVTGFSGMWFISGEYIDPGDETEYSLAAGDAMSLYAYGDIEAPTVTTQAVTDIEITTATGHGTIVSVGIENASKRGVCWNTIGNPTVADDKSEETNSFGTGAFTRPMTGLSPVTHYYVRAYAYNSAGYGYGNEVEFDTAWEAPVSDIDVGPEPVNRDTNRDAGFTYIDMSNPANASGMLHSVQVYVKTDMIGLRVGTFYTTNGNTLKCRDSVLIGDVVAGFHEFTELSIDVVTGDYIGCYFFNGAIEFDISGFPGVWRISGEYIDPNDEATYSVLEGDVMSLYGYGDIVAPPLGQPYISRVQRIAGMKTIGVNQIG